MSVPELLKEKMLVGVKNHLFYVEEGVIRDHSDYGLETIVRLIVPEDRVQAIEEMIANSVREQLDKLMKDIEQIVHDRWWGRITKLETFAEKLGVDPNLFKALTETIVYREEAEKIIRVQEQYPIEFQKWVSSVKSPVENIGQRLFLERDKICEILTDMNVEYTKP